MLIQQFFPHALHSGPLHKIYTMSLSELQRKTVSGHGKSHGMLFPAPWLYHFSALVTDSCRS
jgi:hypothetical protein